MTAGMIALLHIERQRSDDTQTFLPVGPSFGFLIRDSAWDLSSSKAGVPRKGGTSYAAMR